MGGGLGLAPLWGRQLSSTLRVASRTHTVTYFVYSVCVLRHQAPGRFPLVALPACCHVHRGPFGSQRAPAVPPLPFSSLRARGVRWASWPPALLDGPQLFGVNFLAVSQGLLPGVKAAPEPPHRLECLALRLLLCGAGEGVRTKTIGGGRARPAPWAEGAGACNLQAGPCLHCLEVQQGSPEPPWCEKGAVQALSHTATALARLPVWATRRGD